MLILCTSNSHCKCSVLILRSMPCFLSYDDLSKLPKLLLRMLITSELEVGLLMLLNQILATSETPCLVQVLVYIGGWICFL